MVNDKGKIIRFRGKNTVFVDAKFIDEKFSILPSDFALYKALIGDTADNIKAIHKVGP